MTIYCDEAGYTGNHLLDNTQPYFVYSSLKLDETICKEIKDRIYRQYNIQNDEIKGKNIVNSKRGRKLIFELLTDYKHLVRVVFHDKKYVLAAKIVEYGIEPYLSSNYLFYITKLNEFIATGLYVSFITKDISAEKLFDEFLNILRGKKTLEKNVLKEMGTKNPAVDWVLRIITHDPEVIIDEIGEGMNVEKWLLDLTTVSLSGLLTEWSKNGEELEVICDNSKVFDNNQLFNEINKMGIANRRADFLGIQMGFNLKTDITTADSKMHLGLQIADLFASTVFYCLRNQSDDFSKKVMKIVFENCLCTPESFCVTPKLISRQKQFTNNLKLYHSMMCSILDDLRNQ
ncbi:MAG: DUF3800 domain-containing protein [Saprospiraceae bacterium]